MLVAVVAVATRLHLAVHHQEEEQFLLLGSLQCWVGLGLVVQQLAEMA
jgi:hypothetical protein